MNAHSRTIAEARARRADIVRERAAKAPKPTCFPDPPTDPARWSFEKRMAQATSLGGTADRLVKLENEQ